MPGAVVNAEVEAKPEQIEAATGRPLKGKSARQIQEEVNHSLMPRAFPKRASTQVWLDPKAGLVLIDAASMKKADALITRLVELLCGDLLLTPVQTARAPAAGRRDCELKQPDSERATVRCARHTLDINEVGEHLKQGKLPTQLGLTRAGRVSFVLTETLALKKIKIPDLIEALGGQQAPASAAPARPAPADDSTTPWDEVAA